MTTQEIITYSRRALNDLETLMHLYPELEVLSINVSDRDTEGMEVLVNNDTFDSFSKYLQNPYFVDTTHKYRCTRYRSEARYGKLTVVALGPCPPTTYPEREVADDDI